MRVDGLLQRSVSALSTLGGGGASSSSTRTISMTPSLRMRPIRCLLRASASQVRERLTIRRAASSSSLGEGTAPASDTTTTPSIQVEYRLGLPSLSVPLPSRVESCLFMLRPLTDTVGGLCSSIQQEDKGVEIAAIYASDGIRLSAATSIEHLLQLRTFRLRLNDRWLDVTVEEPLNDTIDIRGLDKLREMISSLHASLCLDEYKAEREKRLATALEAAENELRPLEEEKNRIAAECEKHANRMIWVLFASMGVQTGLFARLTWWEYSWDIMEPVTYFSTYMTVFGSAAYYLHTKQSFEYPLAKNRIFSRAFHKKAKSAGFDVDRYLKLNYKVERLRAELTRLRDPLFHHLPATTLKQLEESNLLADAKDTTEKKE